MVLIAVYPGARVVYGRVVEKNLTNVDVEKTQDGIKVHEFYTAKEFPVYEKQSDLSHKGFNLELNIPLIGSQSIHKNGYSQGYTVVTNDMSGRPKSAATYAYRDGGQHNPVKNWTRVFLIRNLNLQLPLLLSFDI